MPKSQLVITQDAAQKGNISSSPLHEITDNYVPHAIFLSHSGKQKGFVNDLYQELTLNSLPTFFDVTHHSLPLGEHFPTHIFNAAKSCEVALLVLSEEFVCSKWPMLELCALVEAMDSGTNLKLLPLFFKLSPADLKCKKNLKRWRNAWTAHAEYKQGSYSKQQQHPIDVFKWEKALGRLSSQKGIIFNAQKASSAEEDQLFYIHRVVSAVSKIVPPFVSFSTTHIAGKDRLCQVILDKFEEMERHQISSPKSVYASTGSLCKVTSVLGLYGLPGSGKSTLCKCLVNYFRALFGSNKTLYLEFSSNPSPEEVVNKLKELLHLTTFRDRVSLDKASTLENVESLLRSCNISSCRVFLVVDNISDKSWEAVHRILHLGFGHGSKIILVAHTLSALCVILDSCKHVLHWACDSIAVPSIEKIEATEILLHAARGSCVAFDRHTLFKSLTSRQKKTVECIVLMCSYGHGRMWLPLVMKAVGARLLKYDKGDLEVWEHDLQSFWTRVETYEQSAMIEELLGENFNALPIKEHLQLLFLDVVLFILHFEENIEEVSDALSMMHGFTATRIRMMIKDLERHCFLTVCGDGLVGVHDVYLKFAKSIQDGPSKYLPATDISWRWEQCQIADAESGKSLLMKEDQSLEDKGKLRALVLEVGESCERVDLQGFTGLKAVVLRNCKSVLVLGLEGLSSLRILEIRNCPRFVRLECSDIDYTSLRNVKRFSVKKKSKSLAQADQEWEQVSCSLQQYIVNPSVKVVIAPFRHSLEMGLMALQMRSLQVVHLENTGIGTLECVSGMWPQLRHLTVIEQHLERLELGCLLNLQQFLFCDVCELKLPGISWRRGFNYRLPDRSSEIWRFKEGDARFLLPGKDLLLGCPQLKRVTMQSSFFKQGQLGSLPAGVVSLELHYLYTATELPDVSLSMDTLEDLDVLWCEKLEKVNLEPGFKSLRTLVLRMCDNMVDVIGLGCLPSLRVLQVVECRKLQSLKGFENSEMLQQLILHGLRELREISCFSSLRELRTLILVDCPNLTISSVAAKADHLCDVGKLKAHLCDMGKLEQCWVSIDGDCCFNLSNCVNLEDLRVYYHSNGTTKCLPGAFKLEGLNKLEKLQGLLIEGEELEEHLHHERDEGIAKRCGFASLLRLGEGSLSLDLSAMATLTSRSSRPPRVQLDPGGSCLQSIRLWGCVDVLDNMEGLGHLATLEECRFSNLCNLRSLRGLESLIQLRTLSVWDCPVLDEVPSLHALVNMATLEIAHCPQLKAVEGCDQMKQLKAARFDGCEGMERLPFSDFTDFNKLLFISFSGCKFESDVKSMAAWLMKEWAPPCVREAARRALLAEAAGRRAGTAHEINQPGPSTLDSETLPTCSRTSSLTQRQNKSYLARIFLTLRLNDVIEQPVGQPRCTGQAL